MAIFWGDNEGKADRLYQKGELERAAQMYLRAKRPERAAEVYQELGKVDEAVELYEGLREWRRAAELLRAQGRPKEAISRFEKGKDFRQAAQLAFEQGHMPRAARLFEQAKMFRRAADCYLKIGDLDRAARSLKEESQQLRQQGGESKSTAFSNETRETDVRRAGLLVKLGRHVEAAELLRELRDFVRAGQIFERAQDFSKAAEVYLEGGQAEAALGAIEQAEGADLELRAEIYIRCARHGDAAQIFENLKRFEAAASAWEGDENWQRSAEMWEKAEDPGRASELFQRAGRLKDSARCFFKASEFETAAEIFEEIGEGLRAAESWEKAGQPMKAGTAYFEAHEGAAARRILETIPTADKDYHRASLLLAPLLFEAGEMTEGQQRLVMVGKVREKLPEQDFLYCKARVAEAQGRWADAETLYRRVFATDGSFRDTAERREHVQRKQRKRLSSSAAKKVDPVDPVGQTTARVSVQPLSSTSTKDPVSTQPFSIGLEEEPPPEPKPRLEVDSAAVRLHLAADFELGKRFEPWWSGAEFFAATDRATNRSVLLVLFHTAELGEGAAFLRQTVRRLTGLDHPSILKLEELVGSEDSLVLVYENFSTRTLQSLLDAGTLSYADRFALVVKLSEALVAAHKLGITHQWISPRTVLVGDQLRPKLAGIGLHEVLSFGEETSRIYLSPELRSGDSVGPSTDMFGLGLLAVTLFDPQLPADWAQREVLAGQEVSWPAEVEELLGPNFRDLLLSCLSTNPSNRPSAETVLNKLQARGLIPGQVLAGRYEILGELGAGGMGRVYRAQDQTLGKEVAIKTVLSPSGGRSEDEDRLFREVQISHKISHPNVVRVHDLGRFPGGIFVTMELLNGVGLDEVIQREREVPLPRAKKILSEIASALAEAHKVRIIHRDLKPANVMLVEDDQVKVLDFGIARQVGASTGNLTATGEVIGSPLYMAPEQIRGKTLDGSCDLYALGVIAFTMLTGREPFLGESSTEIVLQHLKDPPPDASKLRDGGLPEAWSKLLELLLAKEPQDRVRSALELRERLAELPEA
jgi:serine/threonine protein kinase/tetratricopeptide (TPR) repeat protein